MCIRDSLRSARRALREVEVARPRERPPGGGAQYRYGACVRLGVRQEEGATVCSPPSGEASDPEVGRHGAGLTSGVLRWTTIAPQEAGQCPPPPSSKLWELAKVALSWDVPRGGVFDTEPLGEVGVGSFGSERPPPEVLNLEDPVTPAGEPGVPTGGSPCSEQGGSRLEGVTAYQRPTPSGSHTHGDRRGVCVEADPFRSPRSEPYQGEGETSREREVHETSLPLERGGGLKRRASSLGSPLECTSLCRGCASTETPPRLACYVKNQGG